MKNLFKLVLSVAVIFSANSSTVQAELYKVTITNLTRGQIFSPVVAATHNRKLTLFTAGEPASPELAALAQDALSDGLVDLLTASPEVHEVVTGTGVIMPGKSETLLINSHGNRRHISVVSMLVTTNDAFLALNNHRLPRKYSAKTVPAYDAGAEDNDESCDYIPGPPCGNAEVKSDIDGEGYVHIHAGIHGIGNLNSVQHDWRNPVARISIHRVKNNNH